ncbi:amidase [Diaminobutyricimonas sp. LJ205]|uniref:amidase n=1 Tax=Diaminobutyricimonas sp. LJ205 TaxID=2683590 RepID=UPI0012F4ECCF|nr:amidase [Diaminobutyricimonas sp. LJ205]
MSDLHDLTAQEQWTLLQRAEVSPTQLAEHYLARIDRLDAELGAFITVTPERALDRAREVETSVAHSAPLWGLPFADKDLTARAGVRTTYGSRLFAEFVPDVSDPMALAMDAAGGISLGKTNTPEFGLTGYTESLAAPPARNPYDLTLGAGGSSGGAATAVAAGLLPFAPASDGGGSIRIPAASTGLVGIKPTRGLVPAASGVDKVAGLAVGGPIARTVADAAMLLDAMVAAGPYPFTLRFPAPDGPLLAAAVRGEGRFQLGVMTTSPWDDSLDIHLDPAVLEAMALTAGELDELGHGLESIALEPVDYAGFFTTLWQASAASIPADGAELDLLEPLSRWLVERGRSLPVRQLLEALSAATAFERSVIRQFASFDAVLTPTLALLPRPLGWFDQADAEHNFVQQCEAAPFTSFVNVSGLPAITLPVHRTDNGLPVGVQLIGRPGGEATLLSIGAQLERRLRWQHRHPPAWNA